MADHPGHRLRHHDGQVQGDADQVALVAKIARPAMVTVSVMMAVAMIMAVRLMPVVMVV